ncbi:MAG: AAA family ATPase [Minisyncoccia bacterium]
MKVSIFGNPGTGKSTVGKLLASRLGFEFKSSGNMFRDMAAELRMTVEELDVRSQHDSQYDIKLDQMVVEYGKTHDDFIIESRLAWHFIPDSIKLALVCEENEAARRVAEREGISQEKAKENNDLRLATYAKRYPVYYPGLHYPPIEEDFDLMIDVTSIRPDEIVAQIVVFLDGRAS